MNERRSMNWLGLAVVALCIALGYLLFFRKPQQTVRTVASRQASAATSLQGGPMLEGCPVFPADNVWNTRVDGLRVSPLTQSYIDSIGPLHPVHPDFGSAATNGIPLNIMRSDDVAQHVDFDYADESDDIRYPIPANPKIEGGPGASGDRHILMVDTTTCLLYEIFAAERTSSGWHAGSGILMDLTSNALRPERKTSADAAGLPILPGLVRYDEAASGEIHHALRFTVPQTQAAYVWPARHVASKLMSTNYPPLGQRFRLRASFDDSRLSPEVKAIVFALKHYGMVLADNGGSLYISGVPDARWSDDDLHKLAAIHADDFEAVDESSLQLLPDSARVNPARMPR